MSDQVIDQQLDILVQQLSFPLSKIELLEQAESSGMDDDILILLRALPDQDFESKQEIIYHLGEIDPLPGAENIWG